MSGKRPPGFLQKKECPNCGEEHNVSNLPRHQRACEERSKYEHIFNKKISLMELKSFRNGLRRTFNLTLEQYAELYDTQEGKCAICKKKQVEHKNALSVDHCHSTGKVRGLLCDKCNLGLGLFQDDVESLERAVYYLKGT